MIKKRDVVFCEEQLGSSVFRNSAIQKGRFIFDDALTDIPALYAEQQMREHP